MPWGYVRGDRSREARLAVDSRFGTSGCYTLLRGGKRHERSLEDTRFCTYTRQMSCKKSKSKC